MINRDGSLAMGQWHSKLHNINNQIKSKIDPCAIRLA